MVSRSPHERLRHATAHVTRVLLHMSVTLQRSNSKDHIPLLYSYRMGLQRSQLVHSTLPPHRTRTLLLLLPQFQVHRQTMLSSCASLSHAAASHICPPLTHRQPSPSARPAKAHRSHASLSLFLPSLHAFTNDTSRRHHPLPCLSQQPRPEPGPGLPLPLGPVLYYCTTRRSHVTASCGVIHAMRQKGASQKGHTSSATFFPQILQPQVPQLHRPALVPLPIRAPVDKAQMASLYR